METAVALLLGGVITLILWSVLSSNSRSEDDGDSPNVTVINAQPRYNYPLSRSDSPYYIPSWSYGSTWEYRRQHRGWNPRPYSFKQYRPDHLALPARPHITTRPSPVGRIAMSHPIRASSRPGRFLSERGHC